MSDIVDAALASDGFVARALPGYEPRPQQIRLAKAVLGSLTASRHLISEAPCGSGKSLAYLVPGIWHAVKSGKKLIVATANISLQEQLVKKDLPFLKAVMPVEFSYALIKGRQNYACQHRLRRHMRAAAQRGGLHDAKGQDANAAEIARLAQAGWNGDKGMLPFDPDAALWRAVCGDQEECAEGVPRPSKGRVIPGLEAAVEEDGWECGDPGECFYQMAKDVASRADVVVCNQHLLMAHIGLRALTGRDVVLPELNCLVVDEAHELPETARDFFGTRLSQRAISVLARIAARRSAPLAEELDKVAETLFAALKRHYKGRDYRVRLRAPGTCRHEAKLALSAIGRFTALMSEGLESAEIAEASADDDGRKHAQKAASKARALLLRGKSVAARIMSFHDMPDPNVIHWIDEDRESGRIQVISRPIDTARMLEAEMFEKAESVILTSGTMQIGGDMGYMRARIGMERGGEIAVESGFDFESNALIVVPEEAVDPTGKDRNDPPLHVAVANGLRRLLDLAGGRTLALFTSQNNLNLVAAQMADSPHRILIQGRGMGRTQLLDEFRRDVSSSLFGLASFWTGVDVQGESLSVVAIDRLPFPSPADPITDAICERDPDGWFGGHSLPEAVMQFKQGFGRLIRSRTDRGVVVVFDKRIITKNYGRDFLYSVPKCRLSRRMEDVRDHLDRVVGRGAVV